MPGLITTGIPVPDPQRDELRTMFASAAYLTLREILSAHCAEAQAAFANASMYGTEAAGIHVDEAKNKALRFNAALDVLDSIEQKADEWYRITLEQGR
jgi:hypothetical protein